MSNILEVAPADYHSRLRCNRADIFHPDSYLSKSVLWELEKGSLFKWRYHSEPKKTTPAMQWGTLVDLLSTTPELARQTLVTGKYAEYRTKESKEWRDAQLAAGKMILTAAEMTDVRAAAKMLRVTHKKSAEIFRKSRSQVIVVVKINGVKIKSLIDLAPDGEDYLADLKTTVQFSLEGFRRKIAEFGYHVQAGLYLLLWNARFPDDQRHRFKFVWQSQSAPFEVAVTELLPEEIERGKDLALRLLFRLVEAAKNNRWPMAFENEEPLLQRPTWAMMQEEENGIFPK